MTCRAVVHAHSRGKGGCQRHCSCCSNMHVAATQTTLRVCSALGLHTVVTGAMLIARIHWPHLLHALHLARASQAAAALRPSFDTQPPPATCPPSPWPKQHCGGRSSPFGGISCCCCWSSGLSGHTRAVLGEAQAGPVRIFAGAGAMVLYLIGLGLYDEQDITLRYEQAWLKDTSRGGGGAQEGACGGRRRRTLRHGATSRGA